MEGDFFGIHIKPISKALCIIQYFIDRCFEPTFDVSTDQIAGEDEEQKSGNERKGREEKEQFCLEVSSYNLSLPFQIEFDQIPDKDKEKNEEKEEDDDLKGGEESIGDGRGREFLRFTDKEFYSEEKDDEENDDASYETRAFFLFGFHF